MFQLKKLSVDAVPRALQKADRYRVLNEPAEAESICLDVLDVDPDNQQALVTLLLAFTDQAESRSVLAEARAVLARLRDEYERAYYTGILHERQARATMKRDGTGAHFIAYDGFRQAMRWYEKAEALRPPGNDDATLRWNTCARLLMQNPALRPAPDEPSEPMLLE
jgi:hypothetical protein